MKSLAFYIVVLVSLLAQNASAQSASENPTVLYNIGCSSGNCISENLIEPIPAVKFRRKNMDFDHELQPFGGTSKEIYMAALGRFPDAASCLTKEASGPKGFDLQKINWEAQTNPERMEVCLARIHNVIANPDLSVQWFQAVGFTASAHTKRKGHFLEGWSHVNAYWRSDKPFPAKSVAPWYFKLFHGPEFLMGVTLDPDYLVQNASVNFIVK
ncbi:MAG: hypothetical protein ACJA06_002442 [Halocynthiibacter sp.]|jgi:hypothetical protein